MQIDPQGPKLKRQALKALRLSALKSRNLASRKMLCDPAGTVDVSLTSYGDRLATVGYAIESIAQGDTLPRRLILWVSDHDFDVADYPLLARLVRRGLEIRESPDYGPYKKSYPYAVRLRTPGIDLVTADDDVLYPKGWLAGLLRAAQEHPGDVIGYRGAAVSFDADGAALPYAQWRRLSAPEAGNHVLLTGVAGIYYPFAFLAHLAGQGEAFRANCPSADDFWMHRLSLLAGVRPRSIESGSMYLLSIPRTQRNPLHRINVTAGQNDVQFAAITTAAELAAIRRSAQESVT